MPPSIRACLFDVDGVLTRTTPLHAAAWKAAFDELLAARAARDGEPFVPFDPVADYAHYVDSRHRAEGVRAFLASRGIRLPEGSPGDRPGAETVRGVGNRKHELVVGLLETHGAETYDDAVRYLRETTRAGLVTAVVSASTNCGLVLRSAGLAGHFDVQVDGLVAARLGLRGKPAPDTFLAAAEALGIAPRQAAVFEDALPGVEAGRAGGFGYVVAVDRLGRASALRARGADVVVADLTQLLA